MKSLFQLMFGSKWEKTFSIWSHTIYLNNQIKDNKWFEITQRLGYDDANRADIYLITLQAGHGEGHLWSREELGCKCHKSDLKVYLANRSNREEFGTRHRG